MFLFPVDYTRMVAAEDECNGEEWIPTKSEDQWLFKCIMEFILRERMLATRKFDEAKPDQKKNRWAKPDGQNQIRRIFHFQGDEKV
jgi:hypothetical protein